MQKLKLKLDDLSVESFDTTRSEKSKGTVFGEQCTCYTNCTCPGCPTCDYTCDDATCAYTCDDNTCAASCNGTCNCESYNYCGTQFDRTCNGYGTCGRYPCQPIP